MIIFLKYHFLEGFISNEGFIFLKVLFYFLEACIIFLKVLFQMFYLEQNEERLRFGVCSSFEG